MSTLNDLGFITHINLEISGAARGERIGEKRLRMFEFGGLIGVGDSDDPITESEQPLHQSTAYKSPAAQHGARFQVFVHITIATIFVHHFREIVRRCIDESERINLIARRREKMVAKRTKNEVEEKSQGLGRVGWFVCRRLHRNQVGV